MPLNVETFLALPDLAKQIKTLRKADLIALAEHFEIDVTNKIKSEIKDLILQKFVDEGLVESVAGKNGENSDRENDTSTDIKIQLEMKKLELQEKLELRKMEMEREQREIERQERQQKMAMERQRMEMEERIELERIRAQQHASQQHQDSRFDPARNIRLVPKFIERSVDKYFPQFEKVAENLKWPRPTWTTLLQSVLIGKAADVYSAMNVHDSSDYEKVKTAILKAYELVPEAYRQKFRSYKKFDRQTYVEFAREQEDLFDQWMKRKMQMILRRYDK